MANLSCLLEYIDVFLENCITLTYSDIENITTKSIQEKFNLPNEPLAVYNYEQFTSYSVMKLLSKVAGIYGFYCKRTGKIYVGSGKYMRRRLNNHLQKLRSNTALQRDIAKYSLKEGFVIILLEVLGDSTSVSAAELLKAEQFYLDTIPRELLYNILLNAHSSIGFKHSDETKQLLSNRAKGRKPSDEQRAKQGEMFTGEGNPFYGKQHTDSFKQQLSNSHKGTLNPMYGKPKSAEFIAQQGSFGTGTNNPSSKKCTATNTNTGDFLVFNSYTEAATHFGTNRHTVRRWVINGKVQRNGFLFQDKII
jgi:group I intron endonuclease